MKTFFYKLFGFGKVHEPLLNELKSEEKVIRTTRFYEQEIKNLESELAELRAVSYKNKSERAIKQNMVVTIQREWEALREPSVPR